ncbi:MAG: YiiX/YebB-like N1pC/P60 family cysteine hydrolase [Dermatophilaceae bacterium]
MDTPTPDWLAELRAGDFLLTSPHEPSLYSRLIRLFTGSQWTHVAMFAGGETLVEALKDGIVYMPVHRYAQGYDIAVCRVSGATPKHRARAVAIMRAWAATETRYGYLDVVRLGLRRVGWPFHGHSIRQTLFCSEAVVLAYQVAGIEISRLPADEVAPADLGQHIVSIHTHSR